MTDNDSHRSKSKRLGDYLVISKGAINSAIEQQINAFTRGEEVGKLGETLLKNGVITQEDLDASLRRQRMERLERCPVFSSMTKTDLYALSKHFTEVSVAPGETFIMQGEDDPSLFVIASGRVEVYRVDNAGNETHIAEVGEGEPIGEMGYFTGEPRAACVRAIEPAQLLRAEYEKLTHYFENVPRVALAFTKVVESRQRVLEELTSRE